MPKTFELGTFRRLHYRARPSAVLAFALIWLAAFAAGARFLRHNKVWAATGAFLVALAHFGSECWHQIGHARAAEKSGFPMRGVLLVGPLGFSQYPENEGLVPAEVHIQRALGGPLFSALMSFAAASLVVLLRPLGGLALQLTVFVLLDNLFVFTIGALLPLGFTDGSTVLHWRQFIRQGPGLQISGR